MSEYKSSTRNADEATALVKRIKSGTYELLSAICQDDSENKHRLDSAVVEKRKNVEMARDKYAELAKEYDGLSGQLNSAKNRLDDITLEYQTVADENRALLRTMESSNDQTCLNDEDDKLAADIRLRLKLYKLFTGVYFDFPVSNNELTGFVAMKGDKHHHSRLMPFMLKNNNPNISAMLWDKIGESLC